MNYSDTERFRKILESCNCIPTSQVDQADLIIFNTCSVKQKAEDRVIGMYRQIQELKKHDPTLKVILTGCMAKRSWGEVKIDTGIQKREEDREKEIKKVMPWVDIVLQTKDFPKLPKILGLGDTEVQENKEEIESYLSYHPKYSSKFSAYVPISTGCDHFCTYCIVPFARGREVCRSAEEVIIEVFELVKEGYKDITLLGQTVNRWVNPEYDDEIKKGSIANTKIPELNNKPLDRAVLNNWEKMFKKVLGSTDNEKVSIESEITGMVMPRDFLQLIQVLDQIPGNWWTTFLSSHPNYMTAPLIQFLGNSVTNSFVRGGKGHQRPYMHFALQSGSDHILKRMNRRHTYKQFKDVVDMMKKYIPDLTLSTDIIVGFPKETEEDFQKTVDAIKECSFDMAYISEYSPRNGTAAAFLKDDVSRKKKGEWKRYLNEVLAHTALEKNNKLVDTKQLVLIDRIDKKGRCIGRNEGYKQVSIEKGEKKYVGEFVEVEIVECTPWALKGKVIS